jgi:DNA-binding transcriptional MerR regulator
MRSQEKAIFDSIASGALNAQVPFLSKADLMYIASEASKMLGGNTERFTRNALEGWFRAGILPEPTRTDRNRLFSIADVFRAAVVLHLSTCGIGLDVCREAVGILDDQWAYRQFERAAHALDLEGHREIVVSDFLVLATHQGQWLITCELSLEELALYSKRCAGIILLNAVGLFNVTVGLSTEAWDEKARKLLPKLDAEIAKAKQREAK